MPPVFFFAIDVSQAAYACGMVAAAAQTIKACLGELPGDERTMVGFLTYDSNLHFYNLKTSLAAPQVKQDMVCKTFSHGMAMPHEAVCCVEQVVESTVVKPCDCFSASVF